MQVRLRPLMGALLFAVVLAVPVASAPAAPKRPPATAGLAPVTGAADNGTRFAGTFELTRFVQTSAGLAAVGTVSGTLTDAAGNVVGTVTDQAVQLPVADAATPGSGCQILDLTLGPLDLDLLGLVVHLDTVHLNITAQPGPGNLLGNLLCQIVGLFDQNNGGLAGLLNRLLGL